MSDASASPSNPYVITGSAIQEPPTTVAGRLKYLGPGFILTASIVGSGELIATTVLGAKAGFVTLWIILVSCLVKVAIQLEFGKHAIHSGESTLTSCNQLPGPRWGKACWAIWVWVALMLSKAMQVGGIVGGVAILMNMVLPQAPVWLWACITALGAGLMVYRGYYKLLERVCLALIAIFTLFTLASVIFLQFTDYAIHWGQVAEGLSLHLPKAAVGAAMAAFGITGVGGDEIMHYNYWLIEKGYAARVGPRVPGDPAWTRRAKGWIRVMYTDALVSMVIYTTVTAAFYVLGAAVLYQKGAVPEGFTLIQTLSALYTATLGPWAMAIFLVGAFAVLFSTVLASLGGWSRVFTDATAQIGLIDFLDAGQRRRTVGLFTWFFALFWLISFLLIGDPVWMVAVGGIVTCVILWLVVFAAFHFRYVRLPPELKPGKIYDTAFWLSAAAIVAVGIYSVAKLF